VAIRIFEIQRKQGRIALDQLENIRALVPADIQVGRRLAGDGADGQERRPFCVRELELPWRLPIGRHPCAVNGGNRAGKADGRDAIRRNGDGDNHPLVERDALNGGVRERDGRGKEDEAKE